MENTHACVAWKIQYELWVRIAIFKVTPIVKEKFTETGPLNAFEKLFRDNLVGVNINPVKGDNTSHVFFECIHICIFS